MKDFDMLFSDKEWRDGTEDERKEALNCAINHYLTLIGELVKKPILITNGGSK
jgi:hypothetical protein